MRLLGDLDLAEEVCWPDHGGDCPGILVTPATLAQRIVRAKALIRDKAIPYQVPAAQELPERLDAVLQVIYLVFNEGYSARAGAAEVTRAELTGKSIRLGRLLAKLAAWVMVYCPSAFARAATSGAGSFRT